MLENLRQDGLTQRPCTANFNSTCRFGGAMDYRILKLAEVYGSPDRRQFTVAQHPDLERQYRHLLCVRVKRPPLGGSIHSDRQPGVGCLSLNVVTESAWRPAIVLRA